MIESLLSAMEQRVLGSLLEKQITVPASYPLTLNGLRSACNQTSSREPVTAYPDAEIDACLRGLRDRGLIQFVWEGKGSRAVKYAQKLTDELSLTREERALMTVLLLRGAQSAGQLKTRSERLAGFADKEDVSRHLAALAARPHPLVRELPRVAGQQDTRWVHLLGPVPEPEAPAPAEPGLTWKIDGDMAVLRFATTPTAFVQDIPGQRGDTAFRIATDGEGRLLALEVLDLAYLPQR